MGMAQHSLVSQGHLDKESKWHEGIAAAKTIKWSNNWGNKWTSWEQEVGWGAQAHTAVLAAHRDVVFSSSMLSCMDKDDRWPPQLCHEDSTFQAAHKPKQSPWSYAPRRSHCWRDRGVRCWRKDELEKTALVFTTPLSFGIQFYATFFLYEGQKKGQSW